MDKIQKTTCCFTGHRNLSEEQEQNSVLTLIPLLTRLIEDCGCHCFISGMAAGFDLQAAKAVHTMRMAFRELHLWGYLPYRGRYYYEDALLQSCISYCDKIKILSETCTRSCYMQRNQAMVDQSDYVIAAYDGRKQGGTYRTIRYAYRKNKIIFLIRLDKNYQIQKVYWKEPDNNQLKL